jgi:hypothetical protein
MKSISKVLPQGDRIALVVDDSPSVWSASSENVVPVRAYEFFTGRGDPNAPSRIRKQQLLEKNRSVSHKRPRWVNYFYLTCWREVEVSEPPEAKVQKVSHVSDSHIESVLQEYRQKSIKEREFLSALPTLKKSTETKPETLSSSSISVRPKTEDDLSTSQSPTGNVNQSRSKIAEPNIKTQCEQPTRVVRWLSQLIYRSPPSL